MYLGVRRFCENTAVLCELLLSQSFRKTVTSENSVKRLEQSFEFKVFFWNLCNGYILKSVFFKSAFIKIVLLFTILTVISQFSSDTACWVAVLMHCFGHIVLCCFFNMFPAAIASSGYYILRSPNFLCPPSELYLKLLKECEIWRSFLKRNIRLLLHLVFFFNVSSLVQSFTLRLFSSNC